jgi:glycosyltransferase involved in cell wall biosynthesis
MIGHVDLSKDDAPKIHFSNLAREFRKLGVNIRCVLYTPVETEYDQISSDVIVSFLPNPLVGNIFKRSMKYLLCIPFITLEFLRFRPNIIYFRFSPPVFLYLLVIKIFKILSFVYKVIVEFDDWLPEQRAIQGENPFKVNIIKNLQIGTARLSDFIRVVSEGIKRKLLANSVNEKKIKVIGNGTDINHFIPIDRKEAKKRLGLNSNFLYVGFIGNFAIWQGLDYLIKAIPGVLKGNDNIRFILVGDGPQMPKIQKEIAKFKDKEVLLTGRVSYKEAVKYINAFDIGVAPFIKERNTSIGLSPLKIKDYAACGVPIITSRIEGLEIVEKENIGILVPPDDHKALSRTIRKLIKNHAIRKEMGEKGRKIAEKHFQWKEIAEQILEFVLV